MSRKVLINVGVTVGKLIASALLFIMMAMNHLVYAIGYFDPTASTITLPSSLIIPSNTPVGTVVYTSEAVSTELEDTEDNTSHFATYYVIAPTLSSYGNAVYETGIEGLGFRLRAVLKTPSASNITQYYETSDPGWTDYSWVGDSNSYTQYTYLEFVVTGSVGSGSVDLSNYSSWLRYDYSSSEDTSAESWTITLSGSTAVTGTSCEVNTYDTSVDLGTAYTQSLTEVGKTAQPTDFTINMTCSASTLTPSITFSGTPDSNVSSIFSNDSGTATGVGVQLLYGDTAITPDTVLSLGTPTSTSATDYDFKAQLYQTASTVTAGSVDTTVTFTVDYE